MADQWCFSGLGLSRQMSAIGSRVDLPMDEGIFRSLTPDQTMLEIPWRPGLWAHMITLVELFGPIQDLNRRGAQDDIEDDELERAVTHMSQQLQTWEYMLPLEAQMNEHNLSMHRDKGTGGPFLALHLGYHHYSTLLYFRFLEDQQCPTLMRREYVDKCKHHASSFSRLVCLARQEKGCETVYPTVGHMIAVSSSVLLHTLLFGDELELQQARRALNSNFEALVELKEYWPATSSMVSYH